jgi:hypothetical protein
MIFLYFWEGRSRHEVFDFDSSVVGVLGGGFFFRGYAFTGTRCILNLLHDFHLFNAPLSPITPHSEQRVHCQKTVLVLGSAMGGYTGRYTDMDRVCWPPGFGHYPACVAFVYTTAGLSMDVTHRCPLHSSQAKRWSKGLNWGMGVDG